MLPVTHPVSGEVELDGQVFQQHVDCSPKDCPKTGYSHQKPEENTARSASQRGEQEPSKKDEWPSLK